MRFVIESLVVVTCGVSGVESDVVGGPMIAARDERSRNPAGG